MRETPMAAKPTASDDGRPVDVDSDDNMPAPDPADGQFLADHHAAVDPPVDERPRSKRGH
jgi:hypothetical protein